MKKLALSLIMAHKTLKKLEAEVSKQKKFVEEIKQEVMSQMNNIGTSTHNSKHGLISLLETDVYNISDHEEVAKYVYDNKALDIFQNRLSSSALRDRLTEGEKVPGVMTFKKQSLRITTKEVKND